MVNMMTFQRVMLADLSGATYQARKNTLIRELDRLLAQESKQIAMFGFPEPDYHTSELELYRSAHATRNAAVEFEELLEARPLNNEQREVLELVQVAFRRQTTCLIFLQVQLFYPHHWKEQHKSNFSLDAGRRRDWEDSSRQSMRCVDTVAGRIKRCIASGVSAVCHHCAGSA